MARLFDFVFTLLLIGKSKEILLVVTLQFQPSFYNEANMALCATINCESDSISKSVSVKVIQYAEQNCFNTSLQKVSDQGTIRYSEIYL